VHPFATLDPLATEVLWVLLRGRVAERVGERDRAIQSYGWVVGMWRNADPELQRDVREARDGLARLTDEVP
jgi:hypothetical protein